jgi:hypothetical protein
VAVVHARALVVAGADAHLINVIGHCTGLVGIGLELRASGMFPDNLDRCGLTHYYPCPLANQNEGGKHERNVRRVEVSRSGVCGST